MSGQQYWFLNMPIPEIMTALSQWGLNVSNEQLVRPSSDFVIGMYNTCLEQVTSISPNVLYKPTQRALASLEDANPDLYNNAISCSTTYLSAPELERTCFILSAFINFIISNVQEQSAQVIEEREQVIQELSEVQHNVAVLKLTARRAQRAKDEPKCEQLKEENAAMTTQLLAAKEVHIGLIKDINSLKIERAHLQARNATINSESALLMDNNFRTRSRILQSPECIRHNIMTMGTTAIEDKKVVALHEAKARDLRAKISALVNIEKDVRSCIKQLQMMEKEVQLLEGSQKELAELKDKNDKQVEELRMEAGDIETKMAEHLKSSEAELNELLMEYWKLRHETEVYMVTLANKLNMNVSSD
ncbi:hypothetical protein CY34DRAFT_812406 [Suillus luteus UH-Slu-Lm8-n1]|uniref:Kinetochore protein NUF2 n=1 Tax=Suillus luteus UH-Slu-Lm8-n1 TaxID=930992 RepID=A0A0D0ALI0_9AGAM|nr:hypothetical protein CY34DRAFT_812406 [Suillus luteus UH-Slu-Lm8-n1]